MCLPAVSHRRAAADRGTNGEHSKGSPEEMSCKAHFLGDSSLPSVVQNDTLRVWL